MTSFESRGVLNARFSQPTAVSGDFEIQGNDIPGILTLFIDTGRVVQVEGAIGWVDKDSGTTQSAGFIVAEGQSASFTNEAGTTTTLTGSALNDISLELIGNDAAYPEGTIRDFADNPEISGSADINGVLSAMNEYLAWVEARRPLGPVTVDTLVTTDTTPILTGGVILDPDQGETLAVTINGVTYSEDDPELSVDGNIWTLNLSSVDPMDSTIFDVDAVITSQDFYTLADVTSGELTIATAADAALAAVDPTGIIFNGVTSQPVAGAMVQLWTGGMQVPESHLMPGQYNQTTDSDGKYGFDINPEFYASATEFEIRIIPPPGFTFPSRARGDEAVEGGVANIPTAASVTDGIYSINGGDPNPPAVDADGLYALRILWGAGDAQVINNHIPIDPTGDSDSIVIAKKALTTKAALGDIVEYEVTATNTGTTAISGFRITDRLPRQLAYVPGSSKISLTDPTYSVVQSEPVIDQYNVMTWKIEGGLGATIGALLAGESMTVRYAVQVVDTASIDSLTNIASITTTLGESIGNTARATIGLGDQPFFECSSVVGRVFDDRNGNDLQDGPQNYVLDNASASEAQGGGFWSWLMGRPSPFAATPDLGDPSTELNEPGLAGVKLFTVNGTWVTTDAHGRFSIPCADIPKSAFGTNYAVKVLERSLPAGYRVRGGNPKLVRLTRGLSQQLSIAVSKQQGVYVTPEAGNAPMTLFGVPITRPDDEAIGGSNGTDNTRSGPVYLGLVDLRAGLLESNLSNVQKPSDIGVTGRLAVYLKGKIPGNVLLTLMADTGLGDIDGLISGFDDKTARAMLKRINPDEYYPVFGDSSD